MTTLNGFRATRFGAGQEAWRAGSDTATWQASDAFGLDDATPGDAGQPCTCPLCTGQTIREQTLFPSSGTATNGKPIFSWDEAAAQLTRGGYTWSPTLGSGVTISYAFRSNAPTTMPEGTDGFTRFNAAQIAAAEAALALWADVANITFVRIGSGSSGESAFADSASILFANYTTETSSAAGFAYLPNPGSTSASSLAGDIWIDGSESVNQTPVFGDYGPQILAHEIGHAIGLRHPGDYDGGTPTYDANASFWQDSRMFTIMSYFGSLATTGGSLGAFASGPQLLDIAAAQRLYGANMSTRTGDTVYGFNSNTGRQHFTLTAASQAAVFAIWDGGGNDTLDLSGYATDSQIDLRPEAFSSAGPGNGTLAGLYNISIARGAIIENAIGGSGADNMLGNSANNTLRGNGGADILDGGSGIDTLIGGTGDDGYGVDSTNDVVTELAGEGYDAVYSTADFFLPANIEQLNLLGSAGAGYGNELSNALFGNTLANYLNGGLGADYIAGGGGNDIIEGGAGADIMDGGLGDDSYGVDSPSDVVRENPGEGFDAIYASFDYGLGANIEQLNLIGAATAGYGNGGVNAIFGNAAANYLNGGGGDDYLSGAGGDDILDGAAGADIMDGGQGNDSYAVDSGSDVVRENVGEGFDAIYATFNYALGANIEQLNLVGAAVVGYGNDATNALFGNAAANYLNGGGGDDYISGGDGDDILDGAAGGDIMDGGLGNDSYAVDSGSDVVRENAGEGFDAIYASFDYGLGANIEQLNLIGVATAGYGNGGVNAIFGNAAANYLNGGGGDDYLSGAGGDDILDGAAGADIMDGGQGNDSYAVDSGSDVVRENAGEGFDAIYATFNYALGANIEQLNLVGAAVVGYGNDATNALFGNAAANYLNGGGGDDYISGADGDDILDGGAGADIMDGGAGNDSYGVDSAADAPRENPGEGYDAVYSTVSFTLGANIEQLTLQGSAVSGTGNAGDNTIIGNGLANTLNGKGGTDTLTGGGGDDTFVIQPGTGRDTLADFVAGGVEDRIDLSAYTTAGVSYVLSQSGADALFTFANGDLLIVQNVLATNLVQSGDYWL